MPPSSLDCWPKGLRKYVLKDSEMDQTRYKIGSSKIWNLEVSLWVPSEKLKGPCTNSEDRKKEKQARTKIHKNLHEKLRLWGLSHSISQTFALSLEVTKNRAQRSETLRLPSWSPAEIYWTVRPKLFKLIPKSHLWSFVCLHLQKVSQENRRKMCCKTQTIHWAMLSLAYSTDDRK